MRFLTALGVVLTVGCPTSMPRPPDLTYGPDEEVLLNVGGWAMLDYAFFFPVADHCLVVRVGDYGAFGSPVELDAPDDRLGRWRITGSVVRTNCGDARVAWNSLESPSSYIGDPVALDGRLSLELVTVSAAEEYIRLSGELTYPEPWAGGVPRTVVLDRAIAWSLRPGP